MTIVSSVVTCYSGALSIYGQFHVKVPLGFLYSTGIHGMKLRNRIKVTLRGSSVC